MGLFNKKRKNEKKEEMSSGKLKELPELPGLPQLPQLPEEIVDNNEISQLPRFPNGTTGDTFSQNTIKEAISGGKEDEEENVNDFDYQRSSQMMQNPLNKKEKKFTQDIEEISPNSNESLKKMPSQIIEKRNENPPKNTKEEGPLFIRLDKFEESQKIIEELKKQIEDITKMLEKTNEIKQKEEQELLEWAEELNTIKGNVETIEKDLFSKI